MTRLERLTRLRQIAAPAWIIKCEQACLASTRFRFKRTSQRFEALMERYVLPILDDGGPEVR